VSELRGGGEAYHHYTGARRPCPPSTSRGAIKTTPSPQWVCPRKDTAPLDWTSEEQTTKGLTHCGKATRAVTVTLMGVTASAPSYTIFWFGSRQLRNQQACAALRLASNHFCYSFHGSHILLFG
jgi:hypothetical protein